MKKISKKILVCILSFIVLFCSMASTSITVYATEEETTHGGGGHEHKTDLDEGSEKNAENIFQKLGNAMDNFYAMILTQTVAIASGDLEQYVKNRNFMESLANDDGSVNTEKFTYNESTDSVTIDISSLLDMISEKTGIIYVPVDVNTCIYDSFVKSAYKDDRYYFAYETACTDSTSTGLTEVYLFDPSKYYLVWYYDGLWNRGLMAYSKETLKSESGEGFKVHKYSDGFKYSNGWTLSTITYTYSTNCFDTCNHNTSRYYDIKGNVPFYYFENYSKLLQFINNSLYFGSSFGQNSTITIPVSDLEKDWIKAYNDILAELDGIKEATGQRPTQEQIDNAIKKVLGELEDIGGNIGDIGDNVENIDKTLNDLYKLIEECRDYLKKISSKESLDIILDIVDMIRDAISEKGEGELSSEDLEDVKGLLYGIQSVLIEMKSGMAVKDNYTEVLDKIYSLMENMYKLQKLGIALDVTDLLTDFVDLIDGGDTSVFDRISISFSNVANASQERFPTSLPWDLIALFSLFNAEPVVPHYEIPFTIPALGINETIVIDLSEFELLSKASRIFLSILFLLLLMHLTLKIASADKDTIV